MSSAKLVWNDDALEKIRQAPFFIRKYAKKKVEKAAIAEGETSITLELVERVRSKESKN